MCSRMESRLQWCRDAELQQEFSDEDAKDENRQNDGIGWQAGQWPSRFHLPGTRWCTGDWRRSGISHGHFAQSNAFIL